MIARPDQLKGSEDMTLEQVEADFDSLLRNNQPHEVRAMLEALEARRTELRRRINSTGQFAF